MAKKLINLSDKIMDKIKKLADKEKRNVNMQISYMLEKCIEEAPKQEKTLLDTRSEETLKVGAGFC